MELITVTEIINNLSVGLAALIGSGWAVYTFLLARTHVWNLQLKVEHDVVSYQDDRCLVIIKVLLKNVGKVRVKPGLKGCRVSAKRIPHNWSSGIVVDWESLKGKLILDNVDIIARRNNASYPLYEIEPGTEYQEILPIVFNSGDFIMMQTRFWWEDDKDFITNYHIFEVCIKNKGKTHT